MESLCRQSRRGCSSPDQTARRSKAESLEVPQEVIAEFPVPDEY